MTHMIRMIDHLVIGVDTPRIDVGCSLEKEFTQLILNHIDYFHMIV